MASERQHSNNLDFLRLMGAVMVVWGHSYPLAGLPSPSFLWGTSIHTAGLVVFFSISGYLVTGSLLRSESIADYFLKRSLRIFPALAVVVAICAIVVGPLFTKLTLSAYFSHIFFWKYFLNAVLWVEYPLPAVFTENAQRAINGSLWSLPVEFACYILVVLVLAPFRGKTRALRVAAPSAAIVMIAAAIYMRQYYSGEPIRIYHVTLSHALEVIPYFFVGSALYVFRDIVAIRLDAAAACCFATFLAGAIDPVTLSVVRCIALPYMFLAIGLGAWPTISDWQSRFGDASYGAYLYAFPIQQIVAHMWGGKPPIVVMLVVSTMGAIACGWVSWHCLEKRVLKFKPNQRKVSGRPFNAGLAPKSQNPVAPPI